MPRLKYDQNSLRESALIIFQKSKINPKTIQLVIGCFHHIANHLYMALWCPADHTILDKPCIENVKKEAFNDAITVCLKRMEQGSRSAAYLVGKLHQDGLGIKIDFDKAERIYNQLTDEKDKVSALAYLGLADLYKSEQFDKKNYSKSAQFYKLSADLGLADSQLQYGLILFVGRVLKK